MLVNIDYQPAVSQRAGIGRYTRLLARHLPAFLSQEDTTVIGSFYIPELL